MAEIKGGNKLEAALKAIAKKLGSKQTLKVGFLKGATYPDGTLVSMVAIIQNYGAPRRGIPPRPFFNNMVLNKSPAWPKELKAILKVNNFDVGVSLNIMGQHIKEQLQESIIDTDSPPLSPVTVMLRGMKANNPDLKVTGATVGQAAQRVADGKTNYGASTEPLVYSKVMLKSVSFEVVK